MPYDVEDSDDSAELSYRDLWRTLLGTEKSDKYQQQRRTHALKNNHRLVGKLAKSMNSPYIQGLSQILKGAKRTFQATQFQTQALQEFNNYRSKGCAPALALDSNLCASAQTYAQYLANTTTFQHSGTPNVGENLWMEMSSDPITLSSVSGATPVDSWYSEISSYNFSNPGFSSATGHYTQSVWVATTLFGIGIALSSDQTQVYVCAQFTVQGNVQGQFATNVIQPGSTC